MVERNTIYHGDSLTILKTFPDEYFAMGVTSPAYYHLRNYFAEGQIGQERTPFAYTLNLVKVFREVKRVLRSDGLFWLNIGDSRAGSGKGWTGWNGIGNQEKRQGFRKSKPYKSLELKNKDLMEIPSMVEMALQRPWLRCKECRTEYHYTEFGNFYTAEGDQKFVCPKCEKIVDIEVTEQGWWVRTRLPWVKRNSMPESCKDRPSSATEYVFQLSKSGTSYFDHESIRVAHSKLNQEDYESRVRRGMLGWGDQSTAKHSIDSGIIHYAKSKKGRSRSEFHNPAGRQRRDSDSFFESWQGLYEEDDVLLSLVVNPKGNKYAHFACVDTETEALTNEGWKGINELKDGMKIVTFDGKMLSWDTATFKQFPYSGDMVVTEYRDLSMALTPNHRTVCRDYAKKGDWKIKRANKLTFRDEIPTSAAFKKEMDDREISEEYAELVGWVLTDGHYNNGKTISLYQTGGRGKHETIEKLLEITKTEYRLYQRDRDNGDEREYRFSGDLGNFIRTTFPERKGNYRILGIWSDKNLQALFRGMTTGDGNIRKDGRITFVGNKVKSDFYQALCTRLGLTCRLTFRTNGDKGWGGSAWAAYVSKKHSTSLRGTNGVAHLIQKETYEGTVWCPKVNSGMWLARRKGRVFITGNTYPEGLIEPLIKCSTSEFGYCHQCGAPFERVVRKGDPDERWKAECGADSQGQYSGQSEKWLKQDELGKNTYTGFNARWKKTQQNASDVKRRVLEGMANRNTLGWVPTCGCNIIGLETPELYPSFIRDQYAQRLAQKSLLYAYTQYKPARGVLLDPFMGCFDEKTEVLTNHGWKLFEEVKSTDKICSLNPANNKIEFVSHINRIKYRFSGDMYRIKGRSVDLLVTPNHKLYVKEYHHKEFSLVDAEKMEWANFHKKNNGVWASEKRVDPLWLEFMGFWYGDGSIHPAKRGFRIGFHLKKERKKKYLEDLLIKLKINYCKYEYTEDNGLATYHINDIKLKDYFVGNAHTKRVPKYIFTLSSECIGSFLKGFSFADGAQKTGTLYSCNKGLIDQLQTLLLLSGKSGFVLTRNREPVPIKGRTIGGNTPQYELTVHQSPTNLKLRRINVTKEAYSGNVYDVTLERNHILYVRRDGKPCWSGNSGTSAVVAKRFNLDYVGIDLNPTYVKLAEKRVGESL